MANFGIDVISRLDGLSDLGPKQVTKLLPEPMDRNPDGSLCHPELPGGGIAGFGSRQAGREGGEPVAPSRGDVLVFELSLDSLQHGLRPDAIEHCIDGADVCVRRCDSLLGHIKIESELAAVSTALRGTIVIALVGHEIAKRGEEKAAKATSVWLEPGEIIALKQRGEEALNGVFGFVARRTATAKPGVEGRPVKRAEFFEGDARGDGISRVAN